MKKLLYLFSATLMMLNSCSSEDSSSDSPSTDGVLLKKTIETYSDGSKITTNITYDGNKIVSIIDDSGDVNVHYTYTGDLITRMEFKLPNGTVEQINTYEYDSNKRLITYIRSEAPAKEGAKEVYTYNDDGTISIKRYIGDDKTQTTLRGSGKIVFADGEVASITTDYGINYTYTYDNKNNPSKIVLGLNKIPFTESEATGGILHNTVSVKDITNNKVVETAVITYNSADYPLKSVDTNWGETTTTEYFY